MQQLSIHPNVIVLRVGLAAEFRDRCAINRNRAGCDQFFGAAP